MRTVTARGPTLICVTPRHETRKGDKRRTTMCSLRDKLNSILSSGKKFTEAYSFLLFKCCTSEDTLVSIQNNKIDAVPNALVINRPFRSTFTH